MTVVNGPDSALGVTISAGSTVSLIINTTTQPVTEIGGSTLNIPSGPYVKVALSGGLEINSQKMSGSFSLEKKTNDAGVGVVLVTATSLSCDFSAGSTAKVSVTNGGGTFIFTKDGFAGTAQATVTSTVPGLVIVGTFIFEVNTTSSQVNQVVTTTGGTVTVALPVGPFLRIKGNGSLAISSNITVSGEFSFAVSSSSGNKYVQVGVASASASLSAGGVSLDASNISGAMILNDSGVALESAGTFTLTGVTGVTLSATMALEMNTTGAAVNQVVQTGPTTNVTLNFTDGNFLQISGTAVIQVSGLIDISGDFAFRKVGDCAESGDHDWCEQRQCELRRRWGECEFDQWHRSDCG